ncbi:hypothetical protein EDD17DRAFT_1511899 [Pisolithus thermaeus]|nr:hypothetical protein EDD17DRAFT_1511899 [Pisolithus thermaeus]
MASTSESSGWPSDHVPLVGYLSRKALPIKRNDAEPLTREDVQYDLLHHIFCDTQAVFTGQTPGSSAKVNFCDLYVNALYHSSKCSKVLKDKMIETPAFAVELAKISVTHKCWADQHNLWHTALRTYHPVPSLQKTDGNAQDAPRIKNCLKAALLPSELKSMPPSTPEEILEKARARQVPPTSVVNLIFVLANHAAISSADRARAFLWLMFHYLEGPDQPNPYDDDYSRQNLGKVPRLRRLSDAETAEENVDTTDEIEWGKIMSAQRNHFLQRLVTSQENEKKTRSGQAVPSVQRAIRAITKSSGFVLFLAMVIQPFTLSATAEPRAGGSNAHGLQRSMLDHAWHVITKTDPLVDSDEELTDEYVRADYSHRIDVIGRLRGKPPTPPPEPCFVQCEQRA